MKNLSIFLIISLGLSFLYEVFFIDSHAAHGWHAIQGLSIGIGFISGWQLMNAAKKIGSWFLYRETTFYKEKRK